MGAKRAQAEAAKMFTLANFRGYVSGDVHTNTIALRRDWNLVAF